MVKFGCGVLMLLFGAVLTLWLGYNLFIERQADFRLSLCNLLFICGLFFVGYKWVVEGRPDVEEMSQPRQRKKKKKRRPPVEDDAAGTEAERGGRARRHLAEEVDAKLRRRRARAPLSTTAVLAIAGGVIAVALLGLILTLVLRSRSTEPQPPALPSDPGVAISSPSPPPDLEKMERIWILLNLPGNKPVQELTFNGPVGPPHSYGNEISNVRTMQGQAPPAGVYYNHRFWLRLGGAGGQLAGIAVPSDGPFSSAPRPSPCRIVYLRKVGSCQVDFRNPHGSQRLKFGVYEGFYEKTAP